ncbi:MAG: tetratricopeptide repeat protein [Gammaproteobacteria bacterium]
MTATSQGEQLKQDIDQANRLHKAGRLTEAEEAYLSVLARVPDHPEILRLLGLLKHQAGDHDAAIDYLSRSTQRAPGNSRALESLGCLLKEAGRDQEAIACFGRAIECNPEQRSAFYNLGMTLAGSDKRLGEAIEAFERAVALDDSDTLARGALASALLKVGEPQSALKNIDAVLCRDPGDVAALAHRIAALSQLDRLDEIDRLADLDAMVTVTRFEGNGVFATADDLNRHLARNIIEHPGLGTEKTTVNGMDTGEILRSDNPAIETLRQFINAAVDEFASSMPVADDHPLAISRPPTWFLSGWGVRMWSGGFQVPHYHKDAWVSGVYYVQLPPSVRSACESQEGWIELGRGPGDIFAASGPRTRRIRPQEGLLITFPSYMWHRTLPFEDGDERLCISFNVVAES